VSTAGLCYVNGNFLVALDRGDPRALSFLERHRGRLYTIANIMEEDVSGARRVAGEHGIVVRYMNAAEVARQNSIAARLLAEVSKRYTLGENDPRDIDHIAAAVATGARYFVTSEPKLCRWIDEYRDITGSLQCIDWRGGSCSGNTGRDKKDKARTRTENRKNNPRQGPHKGRKRGSTPREDSRGNDRLQAGKDKHARSREKTRGTSQAVREKRKQRKIGRRRQKPKPRKPHRRRGVRRG